jgi:hypothetical protein
MFAPERNLFRRSTKISQTGVLYKRITAERDYLGNYRLIEVVFVRKLYRFGVECQCRQSDVSDDVHKMGARMLRTIAGSFLLIGALVAAFATSPSAAPLQKPDQIRGNCSGDDTYFPPDSSGAYACLKKDGGGITCGGASEEYKKTCETWSASGGPPGRAPGAVRSAAQKKAEKAAADRAAADKARADKAAGDKAAADKAAAEKAKASKPTADKPTTDKPTTDKPSTDKSTTDKSTTDKSTTDKSTTDKSTTAKPPPAAAANVHDCSGIKLNCGSWAPKGGNTCRTCQLAQCKTENGGEVVAGNKTQNECYEGHGTPGQDLR